MAFSKQKLSASTDGRNIKVAATATAGTLIHTAPASGYDEVYLHASNTSTSTVQLTIEWGGTTSPDDLHKYDIPGSGGVVLVIPGWVIQNSLNIRAFAGTANVININGYVHRST